MITALLFLFMMSLRLDVVQRRLASYVSEEITVSYGIPVEIEAVEVRSLNDLRLKKVLVRDLAGDTLICAKEAQAYMETLQLLEGKVRINTLALAAPDVRLNRATPDAPLNIQFIIDIINGNKKQESNLDLRINQISLYDGRFTYDVLSEAPDSMRFDPEHIAISDLACNVSLKKMNSKELDLNIRSISGREKCGFVLEKLKMFVKREGNRFLLSSFELSTPASRLMSDGFAVDVDSTWSNFAFSGDLRSECFDLRDVARFVDVPVDEVRPLAFEAAGFYGDDSVAVDLSLVTEDGGLGLDASVSMRSPFGNERRGKVVVNECFATREMLDRALAIAELDSMGYDITGMLGYTTLKGEALFHDGVVEAKATLACESGTLAAKGFLRPDGGYSLEARARGLKLGRLTGVDALESCNVNAEASGNIKDKNRYAGIKGDVVGLRYNGYSFAPIGFEGEYTGNGFVAKATTDDPNANATLTAKYSNSENMLKFSLKASGVRPYNLCLVETDKGQVYDFNMNGEYFDYGRGKTIVNAKIDNFTMADYNDTTFVRNFYISDNKSGEDRMLMLTSDFVEVSLYGKFDLENIVDGLVESVKSQLPVFDIKSRNKHGGEPNDFYYNIAITDTRPLTHIFGLPLTVLEPSYVKGAFNDRNNSYTIDARINKIDYKGTLIRYLNVNGTSGKNGFQLNAQLQKPVVNDVRNFNYQDVNGDIVVRLNANVANNAINGIVNWNNFNQDEVMSGMVRLNAAFSRDDDGELCLSAKIHEDSIIHKNNVWHIEEGTIAGKLNRLVVENVGLHSDRQSLKVEGVVGKLDSDSLNVALENVEISTLFDLINFRILRFGGKATGTAVLSGVLSNFNADGRLNVDGFTIDGALMGRGDIGVGWDNASKSILLDAGIYNPENDLTTVKGFLSQANDTISLMIDANNLNVAFLDSKMQAFLCETEGAGSGKVHLHGSWRRIDFDGAVALYCATKIKATNVKYYFTGDSITLSKGLMAFNNARLYDRYGNRGSISGSLKHKNLSNWTCLFNIKANELLVYDTDNFESLPFYGTVFGTGDATIKSDSTGFLLKANMKSDPQSRFVYDSNETSGARDNSFVNFTDDNKHKKSDDAAGKAAEAQNVYDSAASKLTLDFMLDVNENLEVKVYTNVQTDDYISFCGTGPINAVYNDKTGFSMKGNLDLVRGTYKFTIQDIFPKVFDIVKGGTLVFNGDPYKAELNLKTKYLVPSASLSDLTTEVTKRKTVKVNCIMNITGSLEAPDLDFDLELPEGSEEERELLASIASTPDQKNMQFVYLLGVGKFYTFDTNSAQTNEVNTSTAVESLISNTISSQLSNMLGKIINNGNWDISGNISTSERGWNSMEVEGMLRGRLLNNRLQINGNLGYRENPIANRNFVGDFELLWLLSPKYNWSIKAYSKTNDRYFTKTDLTTQGIGTSILFEFDSWKWWGKKKKKDRKKAVELQVVPVENADSITQPAFIEIK